MNDCIFCQIVAGKIPSAIVYDGPDFFAFNDINPQAPKHILIVPKRHIERLSDLTDEDAALAGKLLVTISKIAHDQGMDDPGYRVVLNNGEGAGQSVWHIHAHLLSGRPLLWPPG